jgi:Raf kinase inhibitor-like YbhB/YbcL family protein
MRSCSTSSDGRTGCRQLAVLVALALAGCGGGDRVSGAAPSAPAKITLSSPAFPDGGTIPRRYSCDGPGVSPQLRWSGVPSGTEQLALLVEDPDAPGGTFVHWVLFHLAPGLRGLDADTVPDGARQGVNSAGSDGWTGPCPPKGDAPHHYEFTLYALRAPLDLPDGTKPAAVRAAIAKTALARGRLVGRFGR